MHTISDEGVFLQVHLKIFVSKLCMKVICKEFIAVLKNYLLHSISNNYSENNTAL